MKNDIVLGDMIILNDPNSFPQYVMDGKHLSRLYSTGGGVIVRVRFFEALEANIVLIN